MSEHVLDHSCSDESRGHATADAQLSESENGSDVDWIRFHKSKAKQSKEDDSEEHDMSETGDMKEFSLSESAFAVLKPAYDVLAAEEHDLMKDCTASMRQGEHQRAYLALVEETMEKFTSFALSYTGKTLDATATDRLKELQGHFVNDKTELLNQVARNEECTDRLHAHHYRVARQQSWFMSLLHRLVYGSAGNSNTSESGPNPVVKTNPPSTSNANADTPAKKEMLWDNLVTQQVRQIPTATADSDSSGSRFWSSQSSMFDSIASELTAEEDRSSEAFESPDSTWATKMWKIIEGQAELEGGGNIKSKDDG